MRSGRFSKLGALVIALSAVAAACVQEVDEVSGTAPPDEPPSAVEPAGPADASEPIDTDDPQPAATTTPDGDDRVRGELTASDRGVTETTITLGVPLIDLAALQSFGIMTDSQLDERAAWESAVANVNDRGGIAGRMLDLVFVKYLPLGQAQADAACVELVEDNEIFAALGSLLVSEGVLCYTELHGTPFIGIAGSLSDEVLDRSLELALSTDPSISDLQRAMFDYAQSQGVLDRPIAVHGQDQRTIERAVRELEARGADVVSITTVSAPATDVQARVAEFEVIFARWASDGAEAVLNVGTSLDLLTAMGRQEFYIEAFGSEGGAQAYGATEEREFEAMRHLTLVVGAAEVADDHEPTMQCEQAWDQRHPDRLLADNPEQQFPVPATCAAIEMFAAVAEAAGPVLTHESLKAALDAANGVDLPLIGPARLGEGHRSAPMSTNIMRFDEEQRLFVATQSWPIE